MRRLAPAASLLLAASGCYLTHTRVDPAAVDAAVRDAVAVDAPREPVTCDELVVAGCACSTTPAARA